MSSPALRSVNHTPLAKLPADDPAERFRVEASKSARITTAPATASSCIAVASSSGVMRVMTSAGLPADVAVSVTFVLLTLMIAYLSLVLGELVPKRIALQRSAAVALVVGPTLDRFASLMTPVVWLLSASTNAVMRLLGGDPTTTSEAMTDEELRDLIAGHESLAEEERRIHQDVFDAGERTLGEVMRPRGEVTFLAGNLPLAEAAEIIRSNPHSLYPVIGKGFDDVLGLLRTRDLLGGSDGCTVQELARPALFLPVTNRLLPSLASMRAQGAHLAVVVAEYGSTDGIVTLEDMVEELVGEIQAEYDAAESSAENPDRAPAIDAGATIEEFAKITGVELEDGPYETAAGDVINRLGRVAVVGDRVHLDGRDLVVIAVVGRRVTRLWLEGPGR